jgi:hypothetical protein
MRLTRHLFLALVVVALCTGILAGYVVNERGSEPSFIDSLVFIPTVMGKTEHEAVAALEAKGLKAKITYVRATTEQRGPRDRSAAAVRALHFTRDDDQPHRGPAAIAVALPTPVAGKAERHARVFRNVP